MKIEIERLEQLEPATSAPTEPANPGAMIWGLRRRWKPAVAVAVAVFAAALAFTFLSRTEYTATATLMINQRKEQVLREPMEVVGDLPRDSVGIDSEVALLRSPALIGKLIDTLDLAHDKEWNPDGAGAVTRARALAPPGAASVSAGVKRDKMVLRISRKLRVQREKLTSVVGVSITSAYPRKAADMANALARLYFDSQADLRTETAERARAWLDQRLASLKQELEAKEAAVTAYQSEHGLLNAQGSPLTEQQAAELQKTIIAARAEYAEKTARARQLTDLIARGGSADSIASALGSDTIRDLRTREADVARRQAELSLRYGPRNPSLLRVESERADVRAQIDSEIKRLQLNQENEVEIARARLRALEENLSAVRGELTGDNSSRLRLGELQRDAAATRGVYENFLTRAQEIAEQESLRIADARLVSAASPPSLPSSPNILRNLGVGALASVVLGFTVAFGLNAVDGTINKPELIRDRLGLTLLATVPPLSQSDLRMLNPAHCTPADFLIDRPISAFAESFRTLRARLNIRNRNAAHYVVAIVSALPGEGKTSSSLCLARAAALGGQKVLVVDCDVRTRSLTEQLGYSQKGGLKEVMAGKIALADAVMVDSASRAEALTFTGDADSLNDAFSSPSAARLITQAREAYDLVILDCPPVLALADAMLICRSADATVLVAQWGRTPMAAIRDAVRILNEADTSVAGVVLNLAPADATGPYGYLSAHYRRKLGAYYNA
jgi:exopolysaccharide transport family protein